MICPSSERFSYIFQRYHHTHKHSKNLDASQKRKNENEQSILRIFGWGSWRWRQHHYFTSSFGRAGLFYFATKKITIEAHFGKSSRKKIRTDIGFFKIPCPFVQQKQILFQTQEVEFSMSKGTGTCPRTVPHHNYIIDYRSIVRVGKGEERTRWYIVSRTIFVFMSWMCLTTKGWSSPSISHPKQWITQCDKILSRLTRSRYISI